MRDDPVRKPRGNPSLLTPEAVAYLGYLWSQTTLPSSQVAQRIAERFGVAIDPAQHATRRGFRRDLLLASGNAAKPRHVREQEMSVAALARWSENKRRPPDNPRRAKDVRFPVPAGGYRTAATR